MIENKSIYHTADMEDHNLLIRVDENVKNLVVEIKSMKEDNNQTILDHETRIRRLEIIGAIAVGLCYALEFYFNFIRK